jgi:two-component system nitrate/nitrite response regulator NarL
VADHHRLDELVSAFRAGANGYFVDVMPCDAFIKSMELLMMGETIFPPALSFILDPGADHLGEPGGENHQAILVKTEDALTPQLSPREKSILRCLIEGDSNKSIARKIDIAEATVKVHVKAILRKIRVRNRTQAAIWGVNNGSLTRPVHSSSALPPSDMSKRLPKSVGVISEIRQFEPSLPPCAIQEGNSVRKSVKRRIHGAGGLGK